MLKEGDKFPANIKVMNDQNQETTIQKYLGTNTLVIYFYPKDQTAGCTVEACSFRDNQEELQKAGAKVIGISSDDQNSHSKFTKKQNLNFELLSDESHELQEALGIWTKKKMFGHEFMGTLRTTYVIGKDGTILKIWEGVNPLNHGKAVLEFVQAL